MIILTELSITFFIKRFHQFKFHIVTLSGNYDIRINVVYDKRALLMRLIETVLKYFKNKC